MLCTPNHQSQVSTGHQHSALCTSSARACSTPLLSLLCRHSHHARSCGCEGSGLSVNGRQSANPPVSAGVQLFNRLMRASSPTGTRRRRSSHCWRQLGVRAPWRALLHRLLAGLADAAAVASGKQGPQACTQCTCCWCEGKAVRQVLPRAMGRRAVVRAARLSRMRAPVWPPCACGSAVLIEVTGCLLR